MPTPSPDFSRHVEKQTKNLTPQPLSLATNTLKGVAIRTKPADPGYK